MTFLDNFDDPPSIADGSGGRVTDYRVSNFGEFIKECRIAPINPDLINTSTDNSYNTQAIVSLQNITKYWPLTYGESILFSAYQVSFDIYNYYNYCLEI